MTHSQLVNIFKQCRHEGGAHLTQEEITTLLLLGVKTEYFYELLSLSNKRSRETYGTRGYVFAQIGLNAEPCSKDCGFCAMGCGHYSMESEWQKSVEEVKQEAAGLVGQGINDLFLMTTADFPQELFLKYVAATRGLLPASVRLVANIGDMGPAMAAKLREKGCSGAYHIRRLGEGNDTKALPEEREESIRAILNAGLELYYCIEPIGPEHTVEELAQEIVFAKELRPQVMAAMRRVPVPGTPLAAKGQITALELTKIVAIANLVVEPERCMCVHEPMQMPLLAGANQLYAESGANPRDIQSHTEQSRGFSPSAAWALLAEGDWLPARTDKN